VHHGGADEVIAHNNKTSPNDDPVNANSTGHLHHNVSINSSDTAAGNNLTVYTPAPRPPENSSEPLATAANDIKNTSAPEDVPKNYPGSPSRSNHIIIIIIIATLIVITSIWICCKRFRTPRSSAVQNVDKAGDVECARYSAEPPPEYQPMVRVQ